MALAAQPISPPLLTFEAYLVEGEITGHYEIIEGERRFMPGPTWRHQRITGNLVELLRRYEKESRRGLALCAPFDVLIRRLPLQVRQPDVLFISHSRLMAQGGIPDAGVLETAPELVVEIVSDSDTRRVLEAKIADYTAVGVAECWIVHPDAETVAVLRCSPSAVEETCVFRSGETVISPAFPDLVAAVTDVFAR